MNVHRKFFENATADLKEKLVNTPSATCSLTTGMCMMLQAQGKDLSLLSELGKAAQLRA